MDADVLKEFFQTNILSLALSFAAILGTIFYYTLKNRGLPPGPTGLPYIGFWPFMKDDGIHQQFETLKKKHGDIFCFTVTGRLYVNLSSFKLIREAHITKGDCFAERVKGYSLLSLSFGDGVAFANGEQWKASRKFFTPFLKDRSPLSDKDTVYACMYDTMKETVEELKAANGQPIAFIYLVAGKCNAVLQQMIFPSGEVSAKKMKELTDTYTLVAGSMTASSLLLVGEFAKYFLFPFCKNYRESMKNHAVMKKLLYEIIDDHKSSYKEENLRDIIDYFIKERNDRRTKGDPIAEVLTDKCLMCSLYQFIGDGVIATAAFVGIYLKLMADKPEEQEKIYQEIAEVVGLERSPALEDKTRLPYTNAVILEFLRVSDIFPFFPSLQCTKETSIAGYRIPKGAITLINTWSAHNDPNAFEEPEKFNPSRYLIKEGKQRPEIPITFGVGKRACIGESMAMNLIFLFLSTVVQKFKITYPGGQEVVYDFHSSVELELCATPRTISQN